MTTIKSFEEIIAWQKGRLLVIELYKIFKSNRDFSFRDQIQRASISIIANIAEGFERQTNNDFKHYLFMAKGSNGEVRTLLMIAKELDYVDRKQYEHLYELTVDIGKLISGLIKTL